MPKELPRMQMQILNKMMFAVKMKYSEIHEFTEEHDLFNYHLRELVKLKYLTKEDSSYRLTKKGKQFISYMEEDGQRQKQFKVSMFLDLVRKHKGNYQLLLHKRLKQPHYGYIGTVTGKLKWGQSLQANAIRELDEELGIKANAPK